MATPLRDGAATIQLRLGPIARWSVTGVFVLTVATGVYAGTEASAAPAATAIFFVPLCLFLGLGTVATWRSRLDLSPARFVKRGLVRTLIVPVHEIERVSLSAASTGGQDVHVFVAGRVLPVNIGPRYWDRTGVVLEYFRALSADRWGRLAAAVVVAVLFIGMSAFAAARGRWWAVLPLAFPIIGLVLVPWAAATVPRRWFASTQASSA